MSMSEQIKRYAFISYNHRDAKMAKWLQQRLEGYRLPTEIHNEFEDSRYLRPVFRDLTDLNTGVLSQELRQHLYSSKYLIVICSPNSANSQWVSEEVKTFIEWGRLDRIIPFIIDGTPGSSEDECLPEALRTLAHDQELLGISLEQVGREQALVRIVSRMLGVDFDVLWQRHQRRRRRRIVMAIIAVPLITILVGWMALPVTLSVTLCDAMHPSLPMPDDGMLTVDGTDYKLATLDTTVAVASLPGYYRGRSIPVSFHASFYDTLSTKATIGFGLTNTTTLKLVRDMSFAIYAGTVTDSQGIPVVDANVTVEGMTATTDSDGHFHIQFALDRQSETKPLSITKPGYQPIRRYDECPSEDLRYIMYTADAAFQP